MFIKLFSTASNSSFLDRVPVPAWGNMTHSGVTLSGDRTWTALGLVLCAHLAAFATLRPQPQSLLLETEPEPLTVSLLSSPQQATPQKLKLPPILRQKVEKPIFERSQASSQAPAMPVENTFTSMSEKNLESIAKPAATSANKPATASAGFQSPSFNVSYLDNPAPNYPSISRRLGEQGKVLLRVQVAVDGTADSVVLQTSSGSSRLDQAALAAVKKWRFVPARRGGQAVVASVVVPVSFSTGSRYFCERFFRASC